MSRPIVITQATVKVMRSHDYCHFEVSLSAADQGDSTPLSLQEIDELRKSAARLADKAVEQYKVARDYADTPATDLALARIKKLAEIAQVTPEWERTPEEKAIIKAVADRSYEARRYDYQDDWQDREEDGQ